MNKEIEEMAKIILQGELDRNRGYLDCSEFPTNLVIQVGMQRLAGAKALVNAGYRKQKVGRWELQREPNGKPYFFRCSVCDTDMIKVASNFCPHCGAKMEGERRDEDG